VAIIQIHDKITTSASSVMLLTPPAEPGLPGPEIQLLPVVPGRVCRATQTDARAVADEWIRTANECAARARPPVKASPIPIAALA
jgi:hypothetical protein